MKVGMDDYRCDRIGFRGTELLPLMRRRTLHTAGQHGRGGCTRHSVSSKSKKVSFLGEIMPSQELQGSVTRLEDSARVDRTSIHGRLRGVQMLQRRSLILYAVRRGKIP